MLFAQCLHAVTFGALHAVGIALVHQYFTPASHGQGQALFSSLGFGVGGALGAFISGLLWESVGSEMTFMLAAGSVALAVVMAWIWIRPDRKPV
ncbi:MFS transporter [Aliamphritea spongicola]